MKLTKLQRYTAYCILLCELNLNRRGNKSRYCHLIFKTFGITNGGENEKWDGQWYWEATVGDAINGVLKFFPELKKKQPYHGWPQSDKYGIDKRKQWIEQCISETEPK